MFFECIAPITPADMIMRGMSFQPWALSASIRGLMNLYSFVCMAWLTSISCVKVNSMIWMGGYNV